MNTTTEKSPQELEPTDNAKAVDSNALFGLAVVFWTDHDAIGTGRKRKRVTRTLVIEDDGSEDGGRTIARVWRKEDAEAMATAFRWTVSDETGAGAITP